MSWPADQDPRGFSDEKLANALSFISSEGSRMLSSSPFSSPWPPSWNEWDMALMAEAARRVGRRRRWFRRASLKH